jgi:hypothetical protein
MSLASYHNKIGRNKTSYFQEYAKLGDQLLLSQQQEKWQSLLAVNVRGTKLGSDLDSVEKVYLQKNCARNDLTDSLVAALRDSLTTPT